MRKHRIKELRSKLFTAINKLDFKEVKRCVGKAKIKGVQKEIINGEQYGMTPIHFATYRGSKKILQFLLNNGADINAVSDACLVPLKPIVIGRDKLPMEKIVFLCTQDKTSFQGMQNFTALHLALYHCRLDIAKVLLEDGIDINIKSTNGKTAFEVIPDYESLCSDGCDIQKIPLALLRSHENNCRALLLSARINAKLELEAGDTTDATNSAVNPSFIFTRENFKEASSTTSSAVKSSSFIHSIFSWVRALSTATLSGLFSSSPALLPAQQPVAGKIDFNGTALLADVVVRKFTGEKYSMPLDDSFSTIEQIKERKLNSLERDVRMALSKCEKLYRCPGSSLSNSTTSKGIYQKSL
ncbi:transient-receptor-potential calcium channel protein [Wolbachia endosymbiont of Cylisticus convexus]|uniref:ankyrin repeat domain-containing protein n=1 Tax=Wolbachia endosymbiont of Cylisticus convexus TaxID=118728 RepID=UPI000DF6866A|nr:ankyrin repeat domain-containing protein [Wolbachia endosymbiont of Cylisticus convexus]RDD35743.1 transient-receptor-potential calcium channel protein [Wolbachia endosymbiont of Cylisticus convexus]